MLRILCKFTGWRLEFDTALPLRCLPMRSDKDKFTVSDRNSNNTCTRAILAYISVLVSVYSGRKQPRMMVAISQLAWQSLDRHDISQQWPVQSLDRIVPQLPSLYAPTNFDLEVCIWPHLLATNLSPYRIYIWVKRGVVHLLNVILFLLRLR